MKIYFIAKKCFMRREEIGVSELWYDMTIDFWSHNETE